MSSSAALVTRSGGPALAANGGNGGGADLSSSSSTSSMEFERDSSGAKFEWVGTPAGTHGSYNFYKAFKFTSGGGEACGRQRIVGLGDFFLVKMWTHQDIVSIAELQLVWEDRFQPSADHHPHHPHRSTAVAAQQPPPLASLKLYFLPENTPDGRLDEHGQDEVICISEKVVLKVTDLLTWIVDDVKWERGACASTDGGGAAKWPTSAAAPLLDSGLPDGAEFHGGFLDMRDVIKEKQLTGDDGWSQSNEVMVLSYPAYCRYRAALKRLENCDEQYTRHAVMMAIGGASPPGPNTRVVFCKDTFEYPELEDHELLCNHLAPKWKGRRGRKGRKKRSNSPGSESNESESSGSTVTSSRASKDSPLKNGFRRSPMPFNSGRVSADRPKGEQIFLQKLHKFMAGRGTPIGRLPSLGFKQLDLFLFYHKVQRAGGYEAAVANKLWKGIYIELGGHPSNTSAATCTRRHYEKLLLPYERYALANGLADDHLEAASAGNGGSSASASANAGAVLSPPKKRKLSDPSSDHHECQPPAVVVAVVAAGTSQPPEAPSVGHPQQLPTEREVGEVKTETCPAAVSLALCVGSAEAADERPPAAKYPRIVESCIASAGPKIVDSIAPVPSVSAGGHSATDSSGDDSDAEVVILTPVTSSSAPLTSAGLHPHPPIGKVSDSMAAVEALQLKAESDGLQSNLTLKELMLGESMGSLADSKHSALSDLARIATKHKGSLKDVKMHPHSADSIQITVVNKNEPVNSRPSVIQKSASSSSSGASVPSSDKTRTDPQPAHSQKPITPLNPSAELCQYYAQLLAADSSKSPTSIMNDPVGLSLTLGMNLRPPIPAAATPSIFVPTHRIFTDPNLDIKKNRAAAAGGTTTTNSGTPAPSGGSIPAAHSKTAVVQGKPPAGPAVNQTTPATPAAPPVATPPTRNVAPHHPPTHHSSPAALVRPANTPPPLVSAPPPLQPVAAPHSSHHRSAVHLPVKVESSIPLVDLTSRHSSAPSMQPVAASRNADPPTPLVKTEVNGKCLLDLSNKQLQQQLLKSPPSGPVKHAPWSSSPKASGDVSISVNVKVEGQESKRNITESTVTPAAASATNRHSVTVMPVVKDERHRSKTSDKDRVSVTPMHHSSGYPRMVESLVGHSPGGSGMQNSSKNSSAPSPYYGSGSGPSKGSSSTSSSAAKSAPAPAESSMMYPHLLDPALASYYSSLYSPHNLYNSLAAAAAASNPFLAQAPSSMPGFPPHMTSASASAAAAEVTAQVYKDLVQRGYPPALAPGLPPHLGALANIPGLGSLASYTSMYSSLGGKDATGNGERSIPKS